MLGMVAIARGSRRAGVKQTNGNERGRAGHESQYLEWREVSVGFRSTLLVGRHTCLTNCSVTWQILCECRTGRERFLLNLEVVGTIESPVVIWTASGGRGFARMSGGASQIPGLRVFVKRKVWSSLAPPGHFDRRRRPAGAILLGTRKTNRV